MVFGCGVAWRVPTRIYDLSYKICLTINFLYINLTNLLYLGSCFSNSLIFVCIMKIITIVIAYKFSVMLKSITDSPAVTTASFQHSLFSQNCNSSSLDCPYNTIRTGQILRPPTPPSKEPPIQKLSPPPPAPPTTTPPVSQPGKLSGLNDTFFFSVKHMLELTK